MKIIDGRKISEKILMELRKEVREKKLRPCLGVVLVGKEPASAVYVKAKEKAARKIGVRVKKQILSERASEKDILAAVESFNQDSQIGGILVQLPLPKNIPADKIIRAVKAEKDVDGFLPSGRFDSPFVSAIWRAIEETGDGLKDKKALALVNSDVFGRKLTGFLGRKGLCCRYVVFDGLKEAPADLKDIDIVIAALGRPGFVKDDMIKEGAILIDGGISRQGRRVLGDVDASSVGKKAGWLTPTPGGIGPLTVAFLLRNVVLAGSFRAGEKKPGRVK